MLFDSSHHAPTRFRSLLVVHPPLQPSPDEGLRGHRPSAARVAGHRQTVRDAAMRVDGRMKNAQVIRLATAVAWSMHRGTVSPRLLPDPGSCSGPSSLAKACHPQEKVTSFQCEAHSERQKTLRRSAVGWQLATEWRGLIDPPEH